jgi:hypothetical protein
MAMLNRIAAALNQPVQIRFCAGGTTLAFRHDSDWNRFLWEIPNSAIILDALSAAIR